MDQELRRLAEAVKLTAGATQRSESSATQRRGRKGMNVARHYLGVLSSTKKKPLP
jgi:hypothetical protein